jgi:hypothetical protein
MGAFFSSKPRLARPLERGTTQYVIELITRLKAVNPSLVIATIALKEGDEYVPQAYKHNHYTITYNAADHKVIGLYG